MVTGRQVRVARKLLGWNVATLAGMAELTTMIVERAESANGAPSITVAQARKIQVTCEAAGILFGTHGSVAIHENCE